MCVFVWVRVKQSFVILINMKTTEQNEVHTEFIVEETCRASARNKDLWLDENGMLLHQPN